MKAAVERIAESLIRSRARTLALVEAVPEARLVEPAAPFMGPILWDLGHLAWFEELWILRRLGSDSVVDERFDRIYDALDSPRPGRAELDLPSVSETLSYMAEVRDRSLHAIDRVESAADDPLVREGYVYRMVEQHEIQHQETMLQALQMAGEPAVLDVIGTRSGPGSAERAGHAAERERIEIPEGPFEMGTDRWGGTYDNERPRRTVQLGAFAIDRYPVTNRRFLEFIDDGGYGRPELWTGDGWTWRASNGVTAPLAWVVRHGDEAGITRFGREATLAMDEPVQHVSWFEADAFARWSSARLPAEAEWEKAAGWNEKEHSSMHYPWGDAPEPSSRANVGWQRPGPAPIGSYPEGASWYGVEQLVGDVYEWTSSWLENHEGFAAFPYREYSEEFFGRGYRVLRGASWAAHGPLARSTYRNWDLPERRQLFAGFRVVRDLG